MDKCTNVSDWKTVFKKILNGQEHSTETENSCFQERIERANSDTGLLEEKRVQENIPSNFFLVKNSPSNINDSFEDNDCKSVSLNELTSKKLTFHEFNVNKLQGASSSTKQKCDFSSSVKNVQVPEWNKVFKRILGKNSSVPDVREQKNTHIKQKNCQKHDDPVNTRYPSRKKCFELPKSEVNAEEGKVRELFALSRLFKLDYHNNLNEFEGAGVDIFKCDSFAMSFVKESVSKTESTDEFPKPEQNSDSKSHVPLKELFLKSYTTADLLPSSSIPFTEEPWDDDLLI